MAGDVRPNALDKIEITTLQDNCIDLTAMDNSEIITRAGSLQDGEIKKSVLAEHGFSVFVTATRGDRVRTMVFDFGFSPFGAAYNEVTGVDVVHAIIGGFHLSGPLFEPIIEITASAMEEVAPSYIVPAHCTGRKAIGYMETLMPYQFIMNMSGTKLTFSA